MDQSAGNLRVELVRPLLLYRSWIIITAVLFGFAVFVIKQLSATEYTTTMVVVPTSGNDADRISQLSGIASLAGINLRSGSKSVSSYERFMYLITSPELGAWQIKHHDVRQVLFADRWDAAQKTWKPPSGLRHAVTQFFRGLFGGEEGPVLAPNAYAIAGEYDRHLGIRKIQSGASLVQDSGMVALTYTDTNPERAALALRNLVTDTNELLRQDAALRANLQAGYLREKLTNVSVQDYRDTLEKLLSEQEQTLMLTNSDVPFAAQPVSDQDLPAAPTSQRTSLFAVIGAGMGASLAYLLAILAYNWRRDKYGDRGVQSAGRVPVFATLARYARSLR